MITQTFIFLTLVFPCYWFWFHFTSNPYFEMQFVYRISTYHRNHTKISDPSYELVCENNKTVLYVTYGRQLVETIYATNRTTLQYITARVDINNCSAITHHSLTHNNFTHVLLSAQETELVKEIELDTKNYLYSEGGLLFINCKSPLSPDLYKDIVAPCVSEAPESLYSYVLTQNSIVSDVAESVAFSCIQLSPSDRPSMSRVVEMLQRDDDASVILQLEPDLQPLMAKSAMASDSICRMVVVFATVGFTRFFKLAAA